ncbi:16S rRNA (cytidine(1402)-2'-O)-methyltransferase [Roseitranquillus sediminis]|uniref:16S rRNA (cytidine(1402)-2'-O)-methyltransferase n=1 Tax=Roseitranquillus sediminis TaxID=2809051 RepID=UPI001D0C150F|nr:16S rRNA (cytidine(1402)-2'-O)-methyltransferase [Roseitranquillus sediminis]MBM9595266.1 16S rRNA (cytidine(1402)-2'-O)-methyltransferase [Roseitranquillus sediminis]
MSGDPLAPGLYLVATPIGSARDITLRALDILRDADAIAAEDTRTARKLMEIHGIPLNERPLVAYHDHNGPAARPRLMRLLAEGKSLAYVSEAGTPLVADPGYRLAVEAIAAGLPVTAAPGASSVLAALSVAGLPSDRFLFAGFPPTAGAARRSFLAELAPVPATLVLFESPKRCAATLDTMVETLGAGRQAAVCRELTKRFEEVRRGTLAELAEALEAEPPRGEVVIVVDRGHDAPDADAMEAALGEALATMSVRDAADTVAMALGLPRRKVYQAALKMQGGT